MKFSLCLLCFTIGKKGYVGSRVSKKAKGNKVKLPGNVEEGAVEPNQNTLSPCRLLRGRIS